MTETITVAPVVKSVHVNCSDRARVRGVHPRHRLVVAARPTRTSPRRGRARSPGRSVPEARSSRPPRVGSGRTGPRSSSGTRRRALRSPGRSIPRRSPRPRSTSASPRSTTGRTSSWSTGTGSDSVPPHRDARELQRWLGHGARSLRRPARGVIRTRVARGRSRPAAATALRRRRRSAGAAGRRRGVSASARAGRGERRPSPRPRRALPASTT